jgi:hypothetical protein
MATKSASTSASLHAQTITELNGTIEALAAQLKLAKTQKKGRLYPKVSPKGAVSVYGLGRFPTTLYREQWEKILSDDFIAELRDFLKENASSLSVKG